MFHRQLSPSGSDSLHHSASILKKGKACVNCRRRKMRCDGVQPICGSCEKTNRAEDCEYTTGAERSTSEKLEQEIVRLQTRLHHLQTATQNTDPITLQQPYVPGHPHVAGTPSSAAFREPSPNIIRRLADLFLDHASQYGFFLHPGRFRASVLLSAPVGHASRPSPSLLSVMYLLGIHLSQDPEMKRHEKSYLDLAVQQVSQDTASLPVSSSSPAKSLTKGILHVIQAEVILSHYFFANKRGLEARYHLSSALSLGFASGIHKLGAGNSSESTVSFANDLIEEGEQINACWSMFSLDKGWAGVLGCSPNIPCPNVGGPRFTTPLPREIEEYETGHYQSNRRRQSTLHDFYRGTEIPGEAISSRTLHVKAAFLFEQASAFSRIARTGISEQQRAEFHTSFCHFYSLSLAFKSSLPPLESWFSNPAYTLDFKRAAFVAITLLNAALVRFHDTKAIITITAAAPQGDAKARQLRNMCAQEILNISISLASASWNFGHLNPIIGSAWRQAFEVLFQDYEARAATSSAWPPRHPTMSEEDPFRQLLRKGVASFSAYSNSCVFIGAEIQAMMTKIEGTPHV